MYSGRGVLSQYDSSFASQETLVTLASDTGGKAFLDTNNFAGAFTQVHDDTSFYYLLGYISTSQNRDGRYRRITVQVNRADAKSAKLDFRKGYYAPTDFQHTTKETREQQLQEQLQRQLQEQPRKQQADGHDCKEKESIEASRSTTAKLLMQYLKGPYDVEDMDEKHI